MKVNQWPRLHVFWGCIEPRYTVRCLNRLNAPYVQLPPTAKPTPVGFFAPAGHQNPRPWPTLLPVRGVTRTLPLSLLAKGLLCNVRALPPVGSLEWGE